MKTDRILPTLLFFLALTPTPSAARTISSSTASPLSEVTLKVGSGISLVGTEERFFVRGVVEVEL